jgi:hypothetical protein
MPVIVTMAVVIMAVPIAMIMAVPVVTAAMVVVRHRRCGESQTGGKPGGQISQFHWVFPLYVPA